MIVEYIELTMDTTEPRDLAKAMLKFWGFQFEQARISYSATKGRLEGGLRANQQAADEWRRSSDMGFGPPKPFSDRELEMCEQRMPHLKENLEEATAMYGYIVNFITNQAHPKENL